MGVDAGFSSMNGGLSLSPALLHNDLGVPRGADGGSHTAEITWKWLVWCFQVDIPETMITVSVETFWINV